MRGDIVKITRQELKDFINKNSWTTTGDSFEQLYGYTVTDLFPNLELFWKNFVVPSTDRLHRTPGQHQIRQPDNTSAKVRVVGNHNYVIFQHIIKCQSLVNSDDYFAADEFYMHIVAILDNFEQLVEKLILLLSEYVQKYKLKFLNNYPKRIFLKEWQNFMTLIIKSCVSIRWEKVNTQ